jgi:hypothetical protein
VQPRDGRPRSATANTALEHFDASGDVVEQVEYAGVSVGVLPSSL